jgi:hypothetical protein
LVEPTLVTRACGISSGSMTTSGRWARDSARSSAAVRSSVTAMTAWRPAAARSRAHALNPSLPDRCCPRGRTLIATATSLSAAASSTPWMISMEYALKSPVNSSSIAAVAALRRAVGGRRPM